MNELMICLVGREPMPNLILAHDLKPQSVLLCATKETQTRAEYLKFVLENQCGNFFIRKMCSYRINKMYQRTLRATISR